MIFNFPSTFTFTYFICFQIAAMEITRDNVFSSVDCWWLWKEPVLVSQMFKVMSFCLMFARNRFLHWPTASSMTFCDMLGIACPCVNEALLQIASHSRWYRGQVFVQCTHVPASVHKFCSQPDCLADTDPVFPAKGAGLLHKHRVIRLTSERVISVEAI